MKKKLILAILSFCIVLTASSQKKETQYAFDNYHRYYKEACKQKDVEKEKAIDAFRIIFTQHPYRYHSLDKSLDGKECLNQLSDDGIFSGLREKEALLARSHAFRKPYSNPQQEIGNFLTDAFNRIWAIADAYRKGEINEDQALSDKVLKSILHYGGIEVGRPNDGPRFHASCFGMPTAAVNIYFCYLKQMDAAENDERDTLLRQACDMLKVIGLQAWTQPLRHDETDKNVVSISRFRNHVWWVGGNALAYRSLLPVAVMYRSIPMIDLLAEVCRRGISMTSQTTYTDAFWTEGFTADGAGWGHGKQCLIWGYPIDGTSNALTILNMMKGTPWAEGLSRSNAEALLNFLRGGAWYYHKGYRLPCLDRGSYVYNPAERSIPYAGMLNNIIENWMDSFTPEEQKELRQLQREVKTNRIGMESYAPGVYGGTRWFFNNDDLIKKTPDCHVMINMASVRCDGLESAASFADGYNFYPTDGMTLFQRSGDEYFRIMGGWDVTASPGVTSRKGMDKLVPVENWRGYCSKYNYAAGATDGGENAVAGYIFEKMNASDKEGVNDRGNGRNLNDVLYGVKAYKSYFIMGDYMVALGAGVTNMRPHMEGSIHTTIDQTAWTDEVFSMKRGKMEAVASDTHSLLPADGAPLWLMQKGKFAYRVLPEYTRHAFVTCETRPTSWTERNKANEKKADLPAEARILRLWVDHEQRPVDDTYGYVVYTGQRTPADELPFRVLQNDTLVQAVCSADGKVLEAVFYPGNTGLQAEGLSLSASAPCAVLVREEAEEIVVSVTDACMDAALKEIRIVFNGREIKVPMPQGMFCGKPAVVRISKNGTAAERPLKFAIASDFHAQDVPDGKERVASFIQAAERENVDFIIELGDFCRMDSAGQSIMKIWDSYRGDKFHVIGNHDMDKYDYKEYVEGRNMPGRYYSFDKGDFHFIVLDGNNLYDGKEYRHYERGNYYVDPKMRAFVDEEQLAWLKSDLKSTGKKCILFSHQSIDSFMNNGDEVRKILEGENARAGFKKVVLAFSGHNHSNYTKNINGIAYVQINSASYVWIERLSMTEKRYSKEINARYPLLRRSITYDKPLYAVVTLTGKGAEIKGTRAEFVPPTPQELQLGDSIGIYPLVSVIKDADIDF